MTGTTARFKLDEPDKMLATMTLNMTVADWRKVRDALEKGRDGYYGPEHRMVTAIGEVLEQVDKVYYAHAPSREAE